MTAIVTSALIRAAALVQALAVLNSLLSREPSWLANDCCVMTGDFT